MPQENRQGQGFAVTFIVPEAEAGCKLASFLRRRGVSMSLIRHLKYLPGHMQVNGNSAKTNLLLQPADVVRLWLPEEENHVMAEDIPLRIVYETEHVMVVSKPAGLVMHPTLSHKGGTMANAFAHLMRQRGNGRLFRPLGRLDADTSGLVLLAMNAYAATAVSTIGKQYLALVAGCPAVREGTIEAPLAADPESAILQRVCAEGKRSITGYSVLASGKEASLVAVRPQTGRTHQIRVHFAHIGHPLLGDGLYGGSTALLARHALHCAELCFQEPGGGEICLTSALPEDMRRAAQACGIDTSRFCKNYDESI